MGVSGKMGLLKVGSFEIVRSQQDADFYSEWLGKEKCEAVIGQKITIKIQGETHEKLTFQFTYDGTPELNTDPIEAEAGQEKSAVIPNFGGQGTLLYKVLEVTDEAETIESTFNAEKTGAWEMMQKYTPKGLDLKVTKDGKTFEEFWTRV